MPNEYVNFVKQWSRDNNLSYMCAVTDPRLKSDYLKYKKGEEIDLNLKPLKRGITKQAKELKGMSQQDRNVEMREEEDLEVEFKLNPRKKKVVKKKKVEVPVEPKDDRPNVSEQQKANLKKNLGAKEEFYKNLIELLKKSTISYEDFLKQKSDALKDIESVVKYLIETANKYKDGAEILQPYINMFELEIFDSIEPIIYTNETGLITYFLNLKEINEKNSNLVSKQYIELEKIKSIIKSKKYKNG